MDFIKCEPEEQLVFNYTSKSEIKKNEDGRVCTSPKRDSLFKSIIIIHNTDDSKIAGFKIKTTSPKKYCVRPSYGKILPGKSVEISVTDNIQRDTKLDTKFNDKFLIQTTIISESIYELPNEIYSKKISEIFSELEIMKKNDPGSTLLRLKEHKLLCNIEGLNNDDILKRSTIQNGSITSSTITTNNVPESITQNKNSSSYNDNVSEKVPSSITEANLIIKELEDAIQKYSVDSLKNDLLQRRRYEKKSINESTIDGKKETSDPKELFFEWNVNQKKYILNKSCQWQIAFIVIVISFILGAYIF